MMSVVNRQHNHFQLTALEMVETIPQYEIFGINFAKIDLETLDSKRLDELAIELQRTNPEEWNNFLMVFHIFSL